MAAGGVVASCEEHFGRPLLGCRECRRLRVELAVRTGKVRKAKRAEPRSFEHGSRNAARQGLCKVRDGGPCDLCAAALERHRELEREARARQPKRQRTPKPKPKRSGGGVGVGPRRLVLENPDDPRHGSVAGYSAGCRCERCRAGKLKYERERSARGIADDDPRHGTLAGGKAGCRCERCRAANAAHSRELRARRWENRGEVPEDKHGTVSGYNYWLCRCERCLAAHREKRRRYDQGKRNKATAVAAVDVTVVGGAQGRGVQGAPSHGVT